MRAWSRESSRAGARPSNTPWPMNWAIHIVAWNTATACQRGYPWTVAAAAASPGDMIRDDLDDDDDVLACSPVVEVEHHESSKGASHRVHDDIGQHIDECHHHGQVDRGVCQERNLVYSCTDQSIILNPTFVRISGAGASCGVKMCIRARPDQTTTKHWGENDKKLVTNVCSRCKPDESEHWLDDCGKIHRTQTASWDQRIPCQLPFFWNIISRQCENVHYWIYLKLNMFMLLFYQLKLFVTKNWFQTIWLWRHKAEKGRQLLLPSNFYLTYL